MVTVVLDVSSFRARFKAFSSVTTYPNTTIETTWNTSTIYISDVINEFFPSDKLELALQQMTAHLLTISDKLTSSSKQMGIVASSTIGSVSVSMVAPKQVSEWEFWLNQTPYGQQLLALLNTVTAGGFYIGGSYPRLAY